MRESSKMSFIAWNSFSNISQKSSSRRHKKNMCISSSILSSSGNMIGYLSFFVTPSFFRKEQIEVTSQTVTEPVR